MRLILPTFISLLAGASTAMADRVELHFMCNVGSCWPIDQGRGDWNYNDGAWQPFWGLPGCSDNTGIANMVEWCFDTGMARAHFRFAWEPWKRCLGSSQIEIDYENCPGDIMCFATYRMWEVNCTWREGDEADEEPLLVNGVPVEILDGPPPGWNETTRAVPRRAAVTVVDAAKHAD